MIFWLSLIFWHLSYALVFDLTKESKLLVGEIQTTQVKKGEDFSDVAERFDLGYYEVFEANPGVNPDHPAVDTVLVIPTQYILPKELKNNTIVINLAEMRLYYQNKTGDKVYVFPVGIGKEDWETPLGEMTIVAKSKNPNWVVPKSIYEFRKSIGDNIKRVIPPGPDNPLGKYSLRLSQREYLIHGTNIPAGVGRRSSAGCIRLYEQDIKQLFNLVEVGTKVNIINQPYKAIWLNDKLYLEAHMPLFEQRLEMGEDMKQAVDVVSKSFPNRNIKINWGRVKKIAREHLTVPRVVS